MVRRVHRAVVALERSGDGDLTPARSVPTSATGHRERTRGTCLRSAVMLLLVSGLLIGLLGCTSPSSTSGCIAGPVHRPEVDDGRETWLLLGSDSRVAAGLMPDRSVFGSTSEVPGERADVVLLVQEGDGKPPPLGRALLPRDLLVFRAVMASTGWRSPCSTGRGSQRRASAVHWEFRSITSSRSVRRDPTVGRLRGRDRRPFRARDPDPNTGLHLRPGRNHLNGAGGRRPAAPCHPERWRAVSGPPDLDGESVRNRPNVSSCRSWLRRWPTGPDVTPSPSSASSGRQPVRSRPTAAPARSTWCCAWLWRSSEPKTGDRSPTWCRMRPSRWPDRFRKPIVSSIGSAAIGTRPPSCARISVDGQR